MSSNEQNYGPRYIGAHIAGRLRLLAEQFRHFDVVVVGAAETRAPNPGWCHVGSFLALHGPSLESGSHGCSA
eukprot:1038250-Pyramimonas_sp.AAC.1